MKARKKSKSKVAASATKEAPPTCTTEDLCNYMQRLAPKGPILPKRPWENPTPKPQWLEEFYLRYAELYEAVVQLEGYVLCNTPPTKPDPKIATPCRGPSNPPQKSGAPPPPPFP